MDYRAWIIGESVLGDEFYLIHRSTPRFTARIFDEEPPLDLGGCNWELANGQHLARFDWRDPMPGLAKQELLAEDACKALNAYDGILEADLRKAQEEDDLEPFD